MKPAEELSVGRPAAIDPATLGVLCCFSAAILYAVANVCLRMLAVAADPFWAICVKESVSSLAVAPLLVWCVARGGRLFPNARSFWILAAVGLLTQWGGNVPVLWAMGVVGLAVTIPIIVGVNLVASAFLGRLLLGERVARRSWLAIALLIAAVAALSYGAGSANASIAATTERASGLGWVVLAVVTLAGGGVVFSLLNIGIRHSCAAGVSTSTIVVMITGMGTVTLLPFSLWRLGPAGIVATPPGDLTTMLVAGLFNLLAFGSYSVGLRRIKVVQANLVNASQTALAALAGMALFGEPLTVWLAAGVGLTIAGMLLLERPADEAACEAV